MTIAQQMLDLATAAKEASRTLANLSTEVKNQLLESMAQGIEANADTLAAENAKDLKAAEEQGLSSAMIDRLALTPAVIQGMADGLREVAVLPDPVGAISQMTRRPNGIQVGRMRIPLGVIGIVYESRPNVTADAAGLCLKSGNAVILRGGSEAFYSNQAIGRILQAAMEKHDLPAAALQVVPTVDREAVNALLQLEEQIDLIIPRGGEGLIRFVSANSRIPVIKHYKGVCHTFVDASADLAKAEAIAVNEKVQRPGVCNAMETLLIHQSVAETFVPQVVKAMQDEGVEIRGCERVQALAGNVVPANAEDWAAEYLDLILAVKVVDSLSEAIAHITEYASLHTEVIVTESYANAQRFLREINSSVVMVNASSRFSDGSQMGLGAEIGISTTKLHSFGPMGLEDLTTRKFIVMGEGQIRA